MIVRSPVGPIQRAFTGLLGLLDLRGSELAPNSMAGFCQPTIDITSYIQAGVMRQAQIPGTLTPISATASFQNPAVPFVVPDGRVWMVRDVTAILNLLNPDTVEGFGISILNSATATVGPVSLNHVVGRWAPAAASASVAIVSYHPAQPLLLRGGTRFGVSYSGNVVAANRTFSICVSYVDAAL